MLTWAVSVWQWCIETKTLQKYPLLERFRYRLCGLCALVCSLPVSGILTTKISAQFFCFFLLTANKWLAYLQFRQNCSVLASTKKRSVARSRSWPTNLLRSRWWAMRCTSPRTPRGKDVLWCCRTSTWGAASVVAVSERGSSMLSPRYFFQSCHR